MKKIKVVLGLTYGIINYYVLDILICKLAVQKDKF